MIVCASGEPMSGAEYTLVVIGCIALIFFVNYLSKKWDENEETKAKTRKALEEMRAEQRRKEAEEATRIRNDNARIRDGKLKAAMLELENGTYDRTLWAKALIMSDGSQSKAKALYLRLRIGEL